MIFDPHVPMPNWEEAAIRRIELATPADFLAAGADPGTSPRDAARWLAESWGHEATPDLIAAGAARYDRLDGA